MEQQPKKKGFFKRNKNKILKGANGLCALASVSTPVILALMHLINPLFGLVSIPTALAVIITKILKYAPETIEEVKKCTKKILPDAPQEEIDKFIDELSVQHSNLTHRSNLTLPASSEPISEHITPRGQKGKIVAMNAYINLETNDINLTPKNN